MYNLLSKYILRECPFCGSKSIKPKKVLGLYAVRCDRCGSRTRGYYSQKTAEIAWNARNGKIGEMKPQSLLVNVWVEFEEENDGS